MPQWPQQDKRFRLQPSLVIVDELWRQVAESPDDLAPRLVLADALVEVGDSRGELILLQCSRDVNAPAVSQRIGELLDAHWERWLGDVARVLDRGGSWFHRGMLDVVRVGRDGAPDAAYAVAPGHRELACVRRVNAHRCTTAQYVAFVTRLARQPTSLHVRDAVELHELGRFRSPWTTRALRSNTASLDLVPELFPQLARLELYYVDRHYELLRVVPWLVDAMPGLTEIVIHDIGHDELDALRAIPIVQLR